jgi:hypothetical protein
VSDDGKRWWRVTGLASDPVPVYVYDRTSVEAREGAGRGYLEAHRTTEKEVTAYFASLAEPKAEPAVPQRSRTRLALRMLLLAAEEPLEPAGSWDELVALGLPDGASARPPLTEAEVRNLDGIPTRYAFMGAIYPGLPRPPVCPDCGGRGRRPGDPMIVCRCQAQPADLDPA